jgi:regulator of protease activity HflC (stomatin/prohibitin superfamily)
MKMIQKSGFKNSNAKSKYFGFIKQYNILPNQTGYVYNNNVFQNKLSPGVYNFWTPLSKISVYSLSDISRMIDVINQEVLTSDNIALRFSYFYQYRINDGESLLKGIDFNYESNFNYQKIEDSILDQIEIRIGNILQIGIRKLIASLSSEELNEKRTQLQNFLTDEIKSEALKFGIMILDAQVKDITFPKNIQELFARKLEAKIRSQADLENAKTAVATARTLKNAAELIKGDDSIKFFQLMETLNKIAEKGKHTFVIGDGILKKNES